MWWKHHCSATVQNAKREEAALYTQAEAERGSGQFFAEFENKVHAHPPRDVATLGRRADTFTTPHGAAHRSIIWQTPHYTDTLELMLGSSGVTQSSAGHKPERGRVQEEHQKCMMEEHRQAAAAAAQAAGQVGGLQQRMRQTGADLASRTAELGAARVQHQDALSRITQLEVLCLPPSDRSIHANRDRIFVPSSAHLSWSGAPPQEVP